MLGMVKMLRMVRLSFLLGALPIIHAHSSGQASARLGVMQEDGKMMADGLALLEGPIETITKSDTDKATYRYVVLPNRMKALLISDPNCDKAAAAVDVGVGTAFSLHLVDNSPVGYFSDPDHIPGLAHFLEHLLFMGTDRYPSENEYGKVGRRQPTALLIGCGAG